MSEMFQENGMPKLGQGTWFMGESPAKEKAEMESLRLGIELGMTLIDTAEMYGSGASERVIGKAIAGLDRSKLFLVSKVYPHNAGKANIFTSCDNSLDRLGTDYLDLYLLHWRGSVPLRETVECMEELIKRGKIRRWGVSNLDIGDMEELWRVPNGDHCAVDQVLYHLGSRGIEYSLLPWLREHEVPVMAYCPMAQAGSLRRGMLSNRTLLEVAKRLNISPMQVMLSFVLHQTGVIAIPKAGRPEHVKENAAVRDIRLSDEDLRALDRAFPAPTHKTHLDIV